MHRIRQANSDRNRSLNNDSKPPDAEQGRFAISMREFNVVIELDEDGYYVASVPALRGCHTQAKSLNTLMKRIKEAIELCLDVERQNLQPSL